MLVSMVVASAFLSPTLSCLTKHDRRQRRLFGGIARTCIYDKSKELAEVIQPKPQQIV